MEHEYKSYERFVIKTSENIVRKYLIRIYAKDQCFDWLVDRNAKFQDVSKRVFEKFEVEKFCRKFLENEKRDIGGYEIQLKLARVIEDCLGLDMFRFGLYLKNK